MKADAVGSDGGDRWPDPLWRLGYRIAHRCLLAWWYLRRPEARGVGVAVWRGDRLLVVRTSYRGPLLGLPGGGVDAGEDPRAAAARELREELRIEVAPDALREVARTGFDFERRRIEDTVFELRRGTAAQPPRPDRREIVWAGWMTLAELGAEPVMPNLRCYLATLEEGRGGETGPVPADRGVG